MSTFDANQDGVIDPQFDSGINGVTIHLFDANGQEVATTMTDMMGLPVHRSGGGIVHDYRGPAEWLHGWERLPWQPGGRHWR